jgi:hypothetical protein
MMHQLDHDAPTSFAVAPTIQALTATFGCMGRSPCPHNPRGGLRQHCICRPLRCHQHKSQKQSSFILRGIASSACYTPYRFAQILQLNSIYFSSWQIKIDVRVAAIVRILFC